MADSTETEYAFTATIEERQQVALPDIVEAGSRDDFDKKNLAIWLNGQLGSVPELTTNHHYLPINPEGNDFFLALSDGAILAHLLWKLFPNYKFPIKYELKNFHMKQNNVERVINILRRMLTSSTASHEDFAKPTHTVASQILGVIWQLFDRMQEKVIVRDDKVQLDAFLLDWINGILEEENAGLQISNFAADIKDSVAYLHLLHHLNPDCGLEALASSSLTERAQAVLDNAAKLDANAFVTVSDIVGGVQKPNQRFVSNLYDIVINRKEEPAEEPQPETPEDTQKAEEEEQKKTFVQQLDEIDQKREEVIKQKEERIKQDAQQRLEKERQELEELQKANEAAQAKLEMADKVIKAKLAAQSKDDAEKVELIEQQKKQTSLFEQTKKQELDEQDQMIRNMELQIQKQEELRQQQERFVHMTDEELVQAHVTLTAENKQLREEVNIAREVVSNHQLSVEEEALQTQKEQMEYEMDLSKADREKREMLRKENRLKSKLDTAKTAATEKQEQLDELEKHNDALLQENIQLKSENRQKADEVEALEDQLLDQKRTVRKTEARVKQTEQEIQEEKKKEKEHLAEAERVRDQRLKTEAETEATKVETAMVVEERMQQEQRIDTVIQTNEKLLNQLLDLQHQATQVDDQVAFVKERYADQQEEQQLLQKIITEKIRIRNHSQTKHRIRIQSRHRTRLRSEQSRSQLTK